MKGLWAGRDVCAPIEGIEGAGEIEARVQVLVIEEVAKVDVDDHDTITRSQRPGLVGATAKDVPLVLQTSGGVDDHLIAGADQRLVQRGLRRNGSWQRDGTLHLGQLAELPSDLPRVRVGGEPQRDEVAEVWDVDATIPRHRLRRGRLLLGELDAWLCRFEPVALQNLVEAGEIDGSATGDCRSSVFRGRDVRPHVIAQLDFYDTWHKGPRRNRAWGQVRRWEATDFRLVSRREIGAADLAPVCGIVVLCTSFV